MTGGATMGPMKGPNGDGESTASTALSVDEGEEMVTTE